MTATVAAGESSPAAAWAGNRSFNSELLVAVLLGAAALLTAASTYLASARNGEAQEQFTRAFLIRVEAAKARGAGDQLRSFYLDLFVQYGEAVATGNRDLEKFIRVDLGAEPVVRAIEWWRSQNPRPQSPFAKGNPINENALYDRAEQLDGQSKAAYDAAIAAGALGDRFTLATVLFAVVLFASGVAGQFQRRSIHLATLLVASGFLAGGVIFLVLTIR